MIRASACCVATLLLFGCKSGEEPVRGANPGVEPARYAPQPKASREPAEAPRPEEFREPVDLTEAEDEPERDLAAELKAAVGTPLECVRDYTAVEPTTIRISVTATVRPTGVVIEPGAYGAGLSARARDCIERHLERVALPSLEKPVSETVSTIIEIDYDPPVIVESDPGTPEPRLTNVREPLPKRPDIPPSGRPIQQPTSRWISGGFDGGRPIQEPRSRKVRGPKPRPIDGYDVDENAKEWR